MNPPTRYTFQAEPHPIGDKHGEWVRWTDVLDWASSLAAAEYTAGYRAGRLSQPNLAAQGHDLAELLAVADSAGS